MATMNEDDDQCVICFTPLNRTLVISTECNHRFHLECIRKNVENGNDRCPLCSRPLLELVSCFKKDVQGVTIDIAATGKNEKVREERTKQSLF